ncbi:molybdate ABC transporter substrate-binding protein [Gordonia neofelifaecis]|uniref:Molybdate ABC transporter substrate-binding protein ModA n=1 Tax=Gordonia neofelifaecis NRRL B-59395 TaxID=644548 RepID=F1YJA3_9ACTN|nr:molybdate ABC transporter substrate-binding protein [Gordonia neofelifaecis]EGD55136.1 molybdate ABC transporter substrate-binding protein ModA [Gordonia neofelifaecis NRRL B-59395]
MKRLIAGLLALTLLVAGCGSDEQAAASGAAPVKIFAAASLQGSFDELAEQFTAAHPEYSVAPIVYDGSQALATQIVEGADVDVIAFADQSSLKPVTDAGITDHGTVFATNTLQIAVAPGNPKHITTLADLARSDVSTVLCAPEVPCGKASKKLLDAAGVTVHPVSEETNVTSVVNRVEAGEADAGLVYKTDVAAAGDKLTGITPADVTAAVNRYPIAVSKKAPSPEAAVAFEQFVLSPAGQKILAEYGFGSP